MALWQHGYGCITCLEAGSSACQVFFAGTLITCIFNFFLIAVLGTHDESSDAGELYAARKATTTTSPGGATAQSV